MLNKQIVWRSLMTFAIMLLLTPIPFATAQTSGGTSPQCPTPPSTINIQIVIFSEEWPPGTTYLMGVPFEDYVYGVVMGELGPVVPGYGGIYAGQVWSDEVLKAQSVAARTWGSSLCHKHDLNGSSGVYHGATDQVYRPNRSDFDGTTKQHYIAVS